jgi:hypothetical protein
MPFKSEKQRRYMFANEPKIAKKWANEYNMGGVASMFRKKLEDGDLSPEIISQIESMAATGADASTISSLVGVSEEQVNNVLMSGSTSQMMPVEGEEMVETAEVTEEADPLLNLFSQNDSLNNDQALTTLFAEQEPQGIMAAKGGRISFRGGGQDASSDDFGGSSSSSSSSSGGTSGPGDTGGEGGDNPSDNSTSQTSGGNEDIDMGYDANSFGDTTVDVDVATIGGEDGFGEGDYYGPDAFSQDRKDNIQLIMDKYESKIKPTYKDKYNELKKAVKLGKDIMGATSSLLGFLGAGYAIYGAYKEDKAFVEGLNKDIGTLKGMGIPDFTPHTDTSIQTLEQLMVDRLNNKINRDDNDGGSDGPIINPITLEVDEGFAQGENTDYNMMSALDKIRANQARRSGLVESNIVQDNNQIMTANKGGLAGLFRVKNQ